MNEIKMQDEVNSQSSVDKELAWKIRIISIFFEKKILDKLWKITSKPKNRTHKSIKHLR